MVIAFSFFRAVRSPWCRPRGVDELLRDHGLPHGPPLHLEQPGRATELLRAFIRPARLERFGQVAADRTRHVTALVERVHDPHNIAACLRSCDAFGIQDLHVVPQSGAPPRMSRSVAGGAHRRLTVHHHADTESAIAWLRARGYRLAVSDLCGTTPPVDLADVSMGAPLCVAFGNERDGISPRLRAAADLRFQIAMFGFVESFNISVAFALTAQALRQALARERPARAALDAAEAATEIDRWVVQDVPHARAVIEELARRETARLSGNAASA